MQLRFGKREGDSEERELRPPPNYFSRRVQRRLFVLIGSLMLVFILMNEAAKPKNWEWMWSGRLDDSPQQTSGSEPQKVETRLRRSEHLAAVERSAQITPGSTPSESQPTQIVPADDSPLYRAEFDVWSKIWNRLDVDQKSLVQQAVRQASPPQSPLGEPTRDEITQEQRQAWKELVETLDEQWRAYLDDALMAMAEDRGELSEEAKRHWLGVLDQMRKTWNEETRPAFVAVADGEALDSAQQAVVAGFRGMLDEIQLNLVRDNTVWRVAERDAWFRALERLRAASGEQLEAESLGHKGYLQLYDQPKVYRGKLITVRGVVRLAYHERARKNPLGIQGYYVFWLRPAGGPRSPIVVYALDVPPGFPEIKDRDVDRETTTLNEEVEFTGYFFKRWAYQAKDGINTAPLVLAKAPKWAGPSLAGQTPYPSLAMIAAASILMAAIAVGIAAMVYYQSRAITPGATRREVQARLAAKQVAQFSDLEDQPALTERLREMSAAESLNASTAPQPPEVSEG